MRKPAIKVLSGVAVLTAVGLGVTAYWILRDDHRSAKRVTAAEVPGPALPSRQTGPSAPAMPRTEGDWLLRIEEASVEDLRGLIELAMTIDDADLRHAVVTAIVDRWILADARDFTRYFDSLEVYGADRSLTIVTAALQESLTKLDPELAASDEVLVLVQRLISYLAEHDPERAVEWAGNWLLDDTRDAAFATIARSLARTDIAAGLALVDEISSPYRRTQALAMVGAAWAARDPRAAMEWALQLPNHGDRALALNSVLAAVAKEDASSAAGRMLEQARLMDEHYRRERASELAARGLTEADMAEDPDTYREMERDGLVKPPTNPDVELMGDAGTVIGSILASGGVDEAIAWAESFENDYLRLKNLAGVLEGWAKTDPEAAVAFASGNYPMNIDLLNSVYTSWALEDPVSAAAGVNLVSNPMHQAAVLETVVRYWTVAGNFQEAAAYLERLPASVNADSAKLALVNAMSHQQPDQAWRIATGIGDSTLQAKALNTAFSVLVTRNPGQARDLLAGTPLTEPQAAHLGEMVKAVTGN